MSIFKNIQKIRIISEKLFKTNNYKKNKGIRPICDFKEVFFIEHASSLGDDYRCVSCNSKPRNRTPALTISKFFRNWKDSMLHESYLGDPLSDFLKRNCKNYNSFHFFLNVKGGEFKNGVRSENPERMTLEDSSINIFITPDVFGHVLNPKKAFAEIANVLKPGGIHFFTIPFYWDLERTSERVSDKGDGSFMYLEDKMYHGNPINFKGSLVTVDWGRDIADFIHKSSGLTTTIFLKNDRNFGLDAIFQEVFICKKI
jgi:SAM-dependent methyltransferase